MDCHPHVTVLTLNRLSRAQGAEVVRAAAAEVLPGRWWRKSYAAATDAVVHRGTGQSVLKPAD